ncbi:hypothetical protein [Sporosarcina sp. FSL K6-5500]|uniref:hypothetical protein n=1 Tax=Sporosarcina sp. FSL K6-5500 TaxID=2921558 RepID=UPI0030F73270
MEKRYDYITPKDYETAEANGISKRAVYQRVATYQWDIDRAVTQPLRNISSFGLAWVKWEETATKNGIARNRFYHRIKIDGWSEEKAATQKAKTGRWTEQQLEVMEVNNLTPNTVNMRITKMGWTEEKALNTPKMSETERLQRVAEGTKAYYEQREKNDASNGAERKACDAPNSHRSL